MKVNLVTNEDLATLMKVLLTDIKQLLREHVSPADKPNFTTAEVCKKLRVSTGTLAKLRKDGRIEFNAISAKKFTYTPEAVEKARKNLISRVKTCGIIILGLLQLATDNGDCFLDLLNS